MQADVSVLGSNRRRILADDEDYVPPLDTLDRSRLISHCEVKPEVPVFLTYFTLFETPDGSLHKYADVYGFDRVIYKNIKSYIQ